MVDFKSVLFSCNVNWIAKLPDGKNSKNAVTKKVDPAHEARVTRCLSLRVERCDAMAVDRCEKREIRKKQQV